MAKECCLTGKKRNNACSISHSHRRTKKIQNINLQSKKIWSLTLKQWIKKKLSTKAIKVLTKKLL